MTKKINNNEIETLEGVYEETMNSNNQYNEQPKKTKRNFLKPLIIGALAVVVTGGVGAYAYDKYEENQRKKIQDAYSNVKMNVKSSKENNVGNAENTKQNITNNDSSKTNQENQYGKSNQQEFANNTISAQEARRIVAEVVSTPESNIQFSKVSPEYESDYAYQNNGVPLYIYDVEARANGLEYDVKIDAVSGKILKVEIDNQNNRPKT